MPLRVLLPRSLGRVLPPTAPQHRPIFTLGGGLSLPNLLPFGPSSGGGGAPQTITAARRLPYGPGPLYGLIADIDAYASFLPNCVASRATAWSEPDAARGGRRWPTRGRLVVGWGPVTQGFVSRVYCAPAAGVVEAVSGAAGRTGLTDAELAAIGRTREGEEEEEGRRRDEEEGDGTFESLVTRWEVSPAAGKGGWTDVGLTIRYKFANPLYQLATDKFADQVAGDMIEAFEKRARSVLGEAATTTR